MAGVYAAIHDAYLDAFAGEALGPQTRHPDLRDGGIQESAHGQILEDPQHMGISLQARDHFGRSLQGCEGEQPEQVALAQPRHGMRIATHHARARGIAHDNGQGTVGISQFGEAPHQSPRQLVVIVVQGIYLLRALTGRSTSTRVTQASLRSCRAT